MNIRSFQERKTQSALCLIIAQLRGGIDFSEHVIESESLPIYFLQQQSAAI